MPPKNKHPNQKILIIGAGIAGIYTSLELSKNGYKVYLIEKESSIGGNALKVFYNSCYNKSLSNYAKLIKETSNNPNITILLCSELIEFQGTIGNFFAKIKQIIHPAPDMPQKNEIKIFDLHIGAVIITTGYQLMDKRNFDQYAAFCPNVISNLEMEEILLEKIIYKKGLLNNIVKQKIEVISFISCVGSRDLRFKPYCSKLCCNTMVKQALIIKEYFKEIDIFIHYIDMRTSGIIHENYYNNARKAGINFIRGKVGALESIVDSRLRVLGFDSDLCSPVEVIADLVVLSTAIEICDNTKNLLKLLNIKTDNFGFIQSMDFDKGGVETSVKGIFSAGCCNGPKNIFNTIAQAKLAQGSIYKLGKKIIYDYS